MRAASDENKQSYGEQNALLNAHGGQKKTGFCDFTCDNSNEVR
jgi:hypothetical protein